MWRDIQYGLLQISRSKLFTAAVVLLLAAGIGANTVIFSFINALVLRSLPVRNPENLYLLQKIRARQVRPDRSFFYRQFVAIAQDKNVFSSVIAEQGWGNGSFQPFSEGDRVRLITTQIVSPNYFSVLGIKSIAGRVLAEVDATTSSNIPVVISYQFWASEFNRDKGVIGRIIRVKKLARKCGIFSRRLVRGCLYSVAIGLAGEVLGATILMRVADTLVFGISPDDPISFSIAATALLLYMSLAAIGPTWRAARTEPVTALRAE
jgi:ABC-type antimicrobial peptide transport system permease subunit